MSGDTMGPGPAAGRTAAAPPTRRWSDLLPRLLSAIVMIVLALGTAFAGGAAFRMFWLLASGAVLWEWQHLIGLPRATARFAVGAAALAVAVPLADAGRGEIAAVVLLAGGLATAGVAPAGLRAMATAGLVYAAALALAVTLLRASDPAGLASILWLFAIVWGTDVMAYFGGRLVGGPKLWLRLSPAKTWSGFLIGVGSGALLGLAVAVSFSPGVPNVGAILTIGLIAGATAQGGDLFESALKRRYGAKDASHLIPGHGGVMDRLDGFIVAAVFVACLGVARGGIAAAGGGLFLW